MTLLETTSARTAGIDREYDWDHDALRGLEWHPACNRADLEPGWAEAALVAGRQVALVEVGAEVFAVSHIDPHTGAPVMGRGIVGSRRVEGEGHRPTLTSPLLKQVYDLRTGHCYNDPTLRLECYPVRILAGRVEVGVRR